MANKEFRVGQLVVYQNGDSFEIGKIKSIFGDKAFVWYHSGETAARTDFMDLHSLVNGYCIEQTSLGGEEGRGIE